MNPRLVRRTFLKSLLIVPTAAKQVLAYAPQSKPSHTTLLKYNSEDDLTGLEKEIVELAKTYAADKTLKQSKTINEYDEIVFLFGPLPRPNAYSTTHVQVRASKKQKNDYKIFFNYVDQSRGVSTALIYHHKPTKKGIEIAEIGLNEKKEPINKCIRFEETDSKGIYKRTFVTYDPFDFLKNTPKSKTTIVTEKEIDHIFEAIKLLDLAYHPAL